MTSLLTSSVVAQIPSQRAAIRKPPNSVVMSYGGYAGYFVGAGLISGGVVHYPLDPIRYGQIAVAGVVVFIASTVVTEIVLQAGRRPTGLAVLRLVGGSLLLSLGIGMLSGGIQHFMDFAGRASLLIPVGLVASFIAYLLRQNVGLKDPSTLRAGALVLGLAAVALVGLQQFATTLETPATTGHDHKIPSTSGPDAEAGQDGVDVEGVTEGGEHENPGGHDH